MAALNRGSEVTSGLKKVTADMKTKNRTDRTGATCVAKRTHMAYMWQQLLCFACHTNRRKLLCITCLPAQHL